jgi:hypothetical protein
MDASSDSNRAFTFFIIVLLTASGLPFISFFSGGQTIREAPESRSFPEGFSASLCNWKDNKTGALSITFDDGLNSHVANASPIMSLLDLNGTFFVTIDNVGISYGASWAEWQLVANNGHEIASHSKTHPDLRTLDPDQLYEEVVMSKAYIEDNLTDVRCQTFSYPMGLYNETIMDLVRQHYISARQDRHNITAQPGPVPISPPDMYSIVPVEFGTGETASELDGLVDDTITSGGWLVEMIHAVGSGGYDPVDLGQFSSHMQYVASSSDEVWVAPFGNVSKYIQIRDSAWINMTQPEAYLCDIILETPLDELEFDIPVTLNVSFPDDWLDLEIYRGGVPSIHHTKDAGSQRYLVLEMKANERIRIVQANLNPSIEVYEMEPDSGKPFSPLSGDSSQFYWFYLNYTSAANRPPVDRPKVWLDVNGDGDLDDILNGYQEGRLDMSKMDISDSDYTDGCIYYIEELLPPGTHMMIRFSAVDSEGLEAVSSTGMGDWMPGPVLNDPPTLGSDPYILSDHTTRPAFFWEEGSDPDDDVLEYYVWLSYLENGSVILDRHISSTNFTSDRTLQFSTEYNFSVWASDGRGLGSEVRYIHFNLSNEPPSATNDVIIDYQERLVPTFQIIAEPDPDGDWVSYVVTVREMTEGEPIVIYSDKQTVNSTFIPDLELKDHTNYTVSVHQIDAFGFQGGYFEKEFYCNFPPLPIYGGEVKDLMGEEDAVIISWLPSEDGDIRNYLVYKFLDEPRTFDPEIAREVFDVGVNSSMIDRNVTDGETYWYAVMAIDMDGEMDHGNLTIFNGTPKDDVAPIAVKDIRATFQKPGNNLTARVRIGWEESGDGRFYGYRVYRNIGAVENIIGMNPIYYQNGTSEANSTWDLQIEANMTYFYTVTAVDLNGNELKTGLSWTSVTIPYIPPPRPPAEEDDDKDEWDSKRRMYIGTSIAIILILLIGISYLSFMLMQKKTHYYDELEE